MKIGSLFDGSGGFQLAGDMCGIKPRWASEIEPYPIAVTKSHFPDVKHLGSVTDINGAEIEPVDVITFGSPCQDLSVAGKRAGLKHSANGDEETTRSGLFMEAVRIIKEMRKATNGEYPRFAVWENVPGAFSSNKGEDFRIVLEELIRICEPQAPDVPSPGKTGWPYADLYMGDGWSLAYRVFDAQYWGVPQRRRRIYLVLDLGGERAGEVLFEQEGVRGYFETGRTPWQGAAAPAESRTGGRDSENGIIAVASTQGGAEITENGISPTITAAAGMSGNNQPYIAFTANQRDEVRDLGDKAGALQSQPGMKQQTFIVNRHILDDQGGSQITVRTDGKCPTLRAEMHGNIPCVMQSAGFKAGQSMAGNIGWQEECAATLSAQASGTEPTVCIKQHLFENHSQDTRYRGPLDVSPMLPAQLGTGGNNTPFVVEESETCYCLQGNGIDRNIKQNGTGISEGAMYTLNSVDRHAVAYATDVGFFASLEEQSPPLLARDYKDPHVITEIRYIVRRLTPTECARLQGFPDRWGDIPQKDNLTDEEHSFWLNVRNTHATINGRATKAYTKAQMLKWYNKLHSDSSEYKMWGNGIALPNALYVMQGIAEVMAHGRN